MPLDPYYGDLTIQGKIQKRFIAIWPSIYNVINHIFFAVVDGLKELFERIYETIRP